MQRHAGNLLRQRLELVASFRDQPCRDTLETLHQQDSSFPCFRDQPCRDTLETGIIGIPRHRCFRDQPCRDTLETIVGTYKFDRRFRDQPCRDTLETFVTVTSGIVRLQRSAVQRHAGNKCARRTCHSLASEISRAETRWKPRPTPLRIDELQRSAVQRHAGNPIARTKGAICFRDQPCRDTLETKSRTPVLPDCFRDQPCRDTLETAIPETFQSTSFRDQPCRDTLETRHCVTSNSWMLQRSAVQRHAGNQEFWSQTLTAKRSNRISNSFVMLAARTAHAIWCTR